MKQKGVTMKNVRLELMDKLSTAQAEARKLKLLGERSKCKNVKFQIRSIINELKTLGVKEQ